jgi:cytoskeletal protein CcmA (bactofilin family)
LSGGGWYSWRHLLKIYPLPAGSLFFADANQMDDHESSSIIMMLALSALLGVIILICWCRDLLQERAAIRWATQPLVDSDDKGDRPESLQTGLRDAGKDLAAATDQAISLSLRKCELAVQDLISTGELKEMEMLNSTKSGVPEKDKNTATAPALMGRSMQPHDPVWARSEPATKGRMASCIGSDMSIIGKIDCNGSAQVFGRIEGELRASQLLISDGAQVQSNIIAQDVTVCGRVKGTIRAVRVKLQNGGAVEGDIFHRSLSIDENSLFEGSSRRVENPTGAPLLDGKGPQDAYMRSSALAPYLQRVDASGSPDLVRVGS